MKELEIAGRKVQIKEMSYLDAVELDGLGKKEMALKLLQSCTDLPEEEYNKLSILDGKKIMDTINEINSADFQSPVEELDKN